MKKTLLAAALAAFGTAALAEPGYVTQTYGGGPVMNSYGECVHTGTWTPDQAISPCDAVPRAATAPAPVVQQSEPEPARAAEPEPLAQAESPRGPVLEKVSLSTDVLFDFGKAELKDAGKEKLDE